MQTETGQIGVVLLEDGERDSIVVQVGSLTFVVFLHLDHFQVPPPAPAEVKHEGPLGVKVEEKRGLEVVTMKRERDEEQEEGGIPSKRQRLEEGEVVPEESDGFSDSEVEQTLQGVEPSLGQLQGDTYDLLIWMAQLNIKL